MGVFDKLPGLGRGGEADGESGGSSDDGDATGTGQRPADLTPTEFRERAEALTRRSDVPTLDFTVESLDRLDDLAAGPTSPVDDDVAYGSYLGETLIRAYGGEWTAEDGWHVAVPVPDEPTRVAVFDAASMSIAGDPVFAKVAERLEAEGAERTPSDEAGGADDVDSTDHVDSTDEVEGADDVGVAGDVEATDDRDSVADGSPAVDDEPADDEGPAVDERPGVDAPDETEAGVEPTGPSEATGSTEPEDDEARPDAGADDEGSVDGHDDPANSTGRSVHHSAEAAGRQRESEDRQDGAGDRHDEPVASDSVAPESESAAAVDADASAEDSGDTSGELDTASDDSDDEADDGVGGPPTATADRTDAAESRHSSGRADREGEDDTSENGVIEDAEAESREVENKEIEERGPASERSEDGEPENPGTASRTTADAEPVDPETTTGEAFGPETAVDETDGESTDREGEGETDGETDAETDEKTDEETDGETDDESAGSNDLKGYVLREAAEAFAERWSDRDLDFTPDSLPRLDGFVDDQWGGRFDAASVVDRPLDYEDSSDPLTQAGSYYGEVLVRWLDGEWVPTDDGEAAVAVPDVGERTVTVDVFGATRSCLAGPATFAYRFDALANRLHTRAPTVSDGRRDVFDADRGTLTSGEVITQFADAAERFAERWPDYHLDYSPRSIGRLDDLVDDELADPAFADAALADGTDADSLRLTARAAATAAYFSVVLVRHCDAQWRIGDDVELVVDGTHGESTVDPVAAAVDRLRGEETFASVYKAVRG